MPNANPTWSYDAAGNRNDAVCDNLNRATEIGGVACTNDILGNRLTKGTTSYTWDAINRMTSIGTSSSYVYRADGMRVSKTVGEATTRYRYDGQMGMQDVDSSGVVMDYGLGARGIDYMARTSGTTTAVGFPVYDGHGNMVATLARSTGNTFTLGNQRSFDAWGTVRSGSGGDPTGRYCGNLGHKQDDESGLIYMRARYYEPASGRFVSEDPERCGPHWFAYCDSDPCNAIDESGKTGLDANSQTRLWFKFLTKFFEKSGLDPTCLKIAGVALILAGYIALMTALLAKFQAGALTYEVGKILLAGSIILGTGSSGAMSMMAAGGFTMAWSGLCMAVATLNAGWAIWQMIADQSWGLG